MSAALKLPTPELPTPELADPRRDPEYLKTVEVIRGTKMMRPRPAQPHIFAACHLHTRLNMRFGSSGGPGDDGPGGWWILQEPEIHLERNDPIVPDLAGWWRDRLPFFTQEVGITVAPDWLCEVLSPSTAQWDRTVKLPLYAEHGIAHLWLLDPLIRTLESYRLTPDGYLLLRTYGGSQPVRAQPFEAVSLDLACLWSPQAPAP